MTCGENRMDGQRPQNHDAFLVRIASELGSLTYHKSVLGLRLGTTVCPSSRVTPTTLMHPCPRVEPEAHSPTVGGVRGDIEKESFHNRSLSTRSFYFRPVWKDTLTGQGLSSPFFLSFSLSLWSWLGFEWSRFTITCHPEHVWFVAQQLAYRRALRATIATKIPILADGKPGTDCVARSSRNLPRDNGGVKGWEIPNLLEPLVTM